MRVPVSTSLTCIFIAANALTAGGIFTFPLIAPSLQSHLNLSQPQLTTIVLAAMAGQYPLSSVAGKVIDSYGPNVCSFIAASLFSTSFALFAREIADPSPSSFQLLTFYFALAGVGTVFAYFCILFAASKTFPSHLGSASGLTTALFGLSPLIWTEAARWFTDPTTKVLNVSHFLTSLAIGAGSTHLISAFILRVPVSQPEPPSPTDESTSLLPVSSRKPVEDYNAIDLLRDRYFLFLLLATLVNLGICEMVLSNMGTIALSLSSSVSADIASSQVRLLSISNTASRTIVGPLADYFSPSGGILRERRFSRMTFPFAGSLLICVVTLWMALCIRTQEQLWVLSVGIGTGYGSIFTVLPSIVSSIWGTANAARNFGVLTYAPAIGTPIYSYLYAFISSHNTQDQQICSGPSCWRTTFLICACSAFVSMLLSRLLWTKWKDQL